MSMRVPVIALAALVAAIVPAGVVVGAGELGRLLSQSAASGGLKTLPPDEALTA